MLCHPLWPLALAGLVLSSPPILVPEHDLDVQVLAAAQAAGRPGPGRPLDVFVRADDEVAATALGRLLGAPVALRRWRSARLEGPQLLSLLGAGGHLQIQAAPALQPLGWLSLAAIRPAVVRLRGDPLAAETGHGALVGFVDTGLDLGHPAFRDAAGRSRVVAAWDQDAAVGPAPSAFGYGRLCDAASLAADRCPLTDDLGHGTHVAGIAVGGGRSAGVAPGAEIAVVRSHDFTRLADAVLFLVHVAEGRQLPLVINVSVGGQYGPHDGQTPLEQLLAQLAGPGRILVAAAGNDGDAGIHMATELGPAPVRVGLEGVHEGVQALVDLWLPAADELDLGLELWDGSRRLAALELPWVGTGRGQRGSLQLAGQSLLEVTLLCQAAGGAPRGRCALQLEPQAALAVVPPLQLVLRLSGRGRVEGWVSQSRYLASRAHFGRGGRHGWIGGDGAHSIAVPASGPSVLAVGSYSVQDRWLSIADGPQVRTDLLLGGLSRFSSRGPSTAADATGVKPDLCAPGSVVVSARARQLAFNENSLDDELAAMQGTSMAAPHVTGTVAAMLARDPSLDPGQIRSLLRATARADVHTGAVPNSGWGFGKLDSGAAIAAVAAGGGCGGLASSSVWLGLAPCWSLYRRRRQSWQSRRETAKNN